MIKEKETLENEVSIIPSTGKKCFEKKLEIKGSVMILESKSTDCQDDGVREDYDEECMGSEQKLVNANFRC